MTHIKLTRHDELYTANRPSTVVHNILMGQMYLAQVGTVHCKQHSADGQVTTLDFIFKKAGWGGAN
jgi:hypothetical protein